MDETLSRAGVAIVPAPRRERRCDAACWLTSRLDPAIFAGCAPRGARPTDVDCLFVSADFRRFALVEHKDPALERRLSQGQLLALRRLAALPEFTITVAEGHLDDIAGCWHVSPDRLLGDFLPAGAGEVRAMLAAWADASSSAPARAGRARTGRARAAATPRALTRSEQVQIEAARMRWRCSGPRGCLLGKCTDSARWRDGLRVGASFGDQDGLHLLEINRRFLWLLLREAETLPGPEQMQALAALAALPECTVVIVDGAGASDQVRGYRRVWPSGPGERVACDTADVRGRVAEWAAAMDALPAPAPGLPARTTTGELACAA